MISAKKTDRYEQAFRLLPDTVVITDALWYILDYNRALPLEGFRRGRRLTRYMPDCGGLPRDTCRLGGRVFLRSISPVKDGEICVGYVAYLTDITEKEQLLEQRREKSRELKALTEQRARANEELEEYARQVRALTDYEEQLQIAKAIHDDAGHAVTDLNTISRMCLQLRESDPEEYARLIEQGLDLCRRAARGIGRERYDSLTEMLKRLCASAPFPVELSVSGEEPDFAAGLQEVILGVCREAYHNTTAHSLADLLRIQLNMTPEAVTLHILDNGRFHGPLEKGFGLTVMEKNVRTSGGELVLEAEEGRGFGIRANWSRCRAGEGRCRDGASVEREGGT